MSQEGSGSTALTQRYEILHRIGKGKYGSVYKVRDKQTNDCVAMKKVRLDEDSEGVPHWAIREIALVKALKHDSVVRLLNVIHDDRKARLFLVFELMDCDLYCHLQKVTKPVSKDSGPTLLPEADVKSIIKQLLEGVEYCHNHRVVHRDLKPQNILMDKFGTVKIADFGLARAFCLPPRQFSQQMMTLWYRAPEVLLGSTVYAMPVDIWSLGCLLAELASSHPLFPGDSEIDQINRIFRTLGTPTEHIWPGVSQLPFFQSQRPALFPPQPTNVIFQHLSAEGQDLVQKMLTYDPDARITATQALQHPYFKS